MPDKKSKNGKNPPHEKPISLHGPTFEDVMKALSETPPPPKGKKKSAKKKPSQK